ncbi:PML-RARA-regulated adapter molecule 1 [Cyrtonyx montezumae]|uniref:PML-RARA-regulated adapter molecule 1 n=1 Tax=Cyrtonyx montezumae TaxID=9017 RepID=UPI0032D9C36B
MVGATRAGLRAGEPRPTRTRTGWGQSELSEQLPGSVQERIAPGGARICRRGDGIAVPPNAVTAAHPEGKGETGRHLRAKLRDGRKPPPAAGGRAGRPPAASPATEPGRAPAPGSKGEQPPTIPLSGRVGVIGTPPPRSKAQSEGPGSPPMPVPHSTEWMARLKKGVASSSGSHPTAAKPGGRDAVHDIKGVGATSHPPPRDPPPQKWPLLKDRAAPAPHAAAAAAEGGIRGSGHPPRRKPLPHAALLGARPAKPRRPPGVDLEKFHRAAPHGGGGHAAAGPRSTALGYPMPFPPRDALTVRTLSWAAAQLPDSALLRPSGEEEIYDDVESVELLRRDQSFPPPPTFRPPANLHPRGGGGTGGGGAARAPSTVALLAAAQREAQSSRKTKPMTLKECKKEEKADREFQKKFKFEGSIAVLTRMMVDPATTEKRGGGKNLPLRRGEILDVIQFTNKEQILCRNSQRRYGYVPRAAMLHLDTDIYDDVDLYGGCE